MGRHSRLLSIGLVTAAPLLLRAQDPAPLPKEHIDQIERAITATMAEQDIPGLSVAIVTDNQLRYSNGYGLADLENYVPAKASTVYRWASLAKPITATAAVQLAQEGKLDLDKPVQEYCPSFPQKPWPITAR